MKKIVFSLAIIALAAGTITASVNDGGKGAKKKKSCCSTNSGCGQNNSTATPSK